MAIELIHGTERQRLIDHESCCSLCGFMEDGLIAWRDGEGHASVHCAECLTQTGKTDDNGLQMVYLPEMSNKAFSHYLRTLAFVTFAARAGEIGGHDFSQGTVPPSFRSPDAWDAPTKWKTLAEGLYDSEADPRSVRDLAFAKGAFDFLKRRLEYTANKHGAMTWKLMVDFVGWETFDRDYRLMAPGIGIDRIRSWGRSGSSFRVLSR